MKRYKLGICMFSMMIVGAAMVPAMAWAERPVWLHEGTEITKKVEKALLDGVLILHHKPPALLGGGEITTECKGQGVGNLLPEGKLESIEVLGPSGEKTKILCEVTASTNSVCPLGSTVEESPKGLPWPGVLELSGGKIVAKFSEEKGKTPAYESKCKTISIVCEKGGNTNFVENSVNGAVFEVNSAEAAVCSDGGTGTIVGKGTLLGYTVSLVA